MSKDKHQKQEEACGADIRNGAADIRKDADTGAKVDKAGNKASSEAPDGGNEAPEGDKGGLEDISSKLEVIKGELEEKTKQCAEYLDKLQRTAAEFDNFKKRTVKEKEALYADAVVDVVGSFIPVMDNMERALQAMSSDSSAQALKEGVEMVFKQLREAFKKIGVEEIKSLDEQFDPMLHNAVMHVEDDTLGANVIVEEFQKGYIYKEKVIRHSMVKVAN